jgi:hypothetical protein
MEYITPNKNESPDLSYSNITSNRIYSMYKDGVILKQWIDILGSLSERELKEFYDSITYDIDGARGQQLDFIGSIVGIQRALLQDVLDAFFGYIGQANSEGYNVAPYFDSGGAAFSSISDNLFRIAIRAKLAQNTTNSTSDEVILSSSFLLGQPVLMVDNEDMSFALQLTEELNPEVIAVLVYYNLEIKPAGVRFLGYLQV